jgi:hypothetical protein
MHHHSNSSDNKKPKLERHLSQLWSTGAQNVVPAALIAAGKCIWDLHNLGCLKKNDPNGKNPRSKPVWEMSMLAFQLSMLRKTVISWLEKSYSIWITYQMETKYNFPGSRFLICQNSGCPTPYSGLITFHSDDNNSSQWAEARRDWSFGSC